MTDLPYASVVPVFDGYLARLDGLIARAMGLEDARLAPDMFDLEEQARIAAQFTLRVACPLAGQAVPPSPDDLPLADVVRATRAQLGLLTPPMFADAGNRRYSVEAGQGIRDLDAETFLLQFGIPNIQFHMAMVYALLRSKGVAVGKADFDGVHVYEAGFSFSD
ncbi:hypothetical protein FHS89_002850 [Rubricella aquisinus]|uniref:DUF1993 domain-containing protein n=1 Tax=Rubricella aquisinus TaxID=2028108 RepID=A0A840WP23_9RHOB|nr:hypothetical protein [Rubricella aquisinus]